MKLVGADALLADAHEVERHQPLVEGDMATLHQRAGRDREILAAFLLSATIPARLLGLVGMIDSAAVRADRAFWPALPLKPFAGIFGDWKCGAVKALDMA